MISITHNIARSSEVPGFGDPVPPGSPMPPVANKRPARKPAAKKTSTKKRKAGRPARVPGAAKVTRTRRGPPALTLNVSSAFDLLSNCKRKDVAAVQQITSILDPLNGKARARVLEVVKSILER